MVALLRKVSIAVVTLALAGFISTPPASADLSDVLSAGTVKIAVPENFPPFGSLGASGEEQGYDIDVARLLAKSLGVELELVPVASKQRLPFLETGRVDLVIASLGANPARAKSIWFSNAYAPFFSGAFATPEMTIHSPADLAGKKVGVTGGTIEDLALTKRVPESAEIVRFGDNAATLQAYAADQVDVLVTGNTVAADFAKNHPDKKIETKFIVKNSPCFIGIKRGDIDFLRWVNVFVHHAKLSGELNNLSEKWFGQELPPLPTM